ncbi:hypothetical protein B0T21DRAFT_278298 [Apiosordaria backusii]|uniref:Zn(2)-C6 fungal-type domain-containing protein n=1 Tax=Apiosordaria backusii TaxID=314023 RepID=A0AA40K6P3_9PEZI|nr:hypothetical protein B0T21DRAFT_278298 [Apiosordaria backusii]
MAPLLASGGLFTQTWNGHIAYSLPSPRYIKKKTATMEPEQPAGYFSTFSILDPNRTNPEGPGKPQKRNRRVYVCIPCHRRKLKCDKGQPCSRCIQANAADDCVYQKFPFSSKHESGAEPGETPQSPTQDSPQATPGPSGNEARPRLHGITHWSTIASEFREGWPYIAGLDPEWGPRFRHLQSLKYLVAALPVHHFPFGEICHCSETRENALQSLPPRPVVGTLVRCYFETFHPIYRLLHPREFECELEAFWINVNQHSEEWLAQFFMILALGCKAAPVQVFASTGRRPGAWIDQFLNSSQFFLCRSPVASAPTLASARTLCLGVIARLMDIVKGGETLQLASLMGYVSRMAVSMHLNRTTSLFPELSPFEAELRKRLWVTIQLLELQVAMRTGTSCIHQDYDAEPPLNIDDTSIYHTEHGWILDPTTTQPDYILTDATFQTRLSDIIPTLSEITNMLNTTQFTAPKYDKIQTWDEQLRRKLQEAASVLLMAAQSQAKYPHRPRIQLDFFRILIHRSLLALHHHYISAPRFKQFPSSSHAIIRSSLEILNVHQSWYKPSTTTAPRHRHHSNIPYPTHSAAVALGKAPEATLFNNNNSSYLSKLVLLDLSRDSFGAAMLYLVVSCRRLSLNAIQIQQQQQQPSSEARFATTTPTMITNQNDIRALVSSRLEDFRERACNSPSHYDEFISLAVAEGCLRVLLLSGGNNNGGNMVAGGLREVADGIERTILEGKLWTGSGGGGGGGGTGFTPVTPGGGFAEGGGGFMFPP